MPRLHDHVWSHPSAGAARSYSLPRGMIAAAGCPQGPGVPEPEHAPRGQRAGTAGCSARPGSWHHDLVQRSLVLFSFGVVLALVLNLLQIQRNVTLFPDEVIATIFSSAWWVPPCCGTAAGECLSLFLGLGVREEGTRQLLKSPSFQEREDGEGREPQTLASDRRKLEGLVMEMRSGDNWQFKWMSRRCLAEPEVRIGRLENW